MNDARKTEAEQMHRERVGCRIAELVVVQSKRTSHRERASYRIAQIRAMRKYRTDKEPTVGSQQRTRTSRTENEPAAGSRRERPSYWYKDKSKFRKPERVVAQSRTETRQFAQELTQRKSHARKLHALRQSNIAHKSL